MIKQKKCRVCKEEFTPFQSTQVVCSPPCAFQYSKDKRLKSELKEWSKRKKVLKKKLETPSQQRNKLQEVFNEFIRLRDQGKPCISCGKPLGEIYHAGHLYSVGGFPELRYHESNVNGQCEWCNIHLHGNGNLYRLGLIERIGEERVRELDKLRGIPAKFTRTEIEEMIEKYRAIIRRMKKK